MSAIRTTPPAITPLDRFGLTLSLAILFHAVVILGITFTGEDQSRVRYNTMEIVLVQQSTKKAPEKAEILAQANLEGGGDVEESVSPATPTPAPFPDVKPEIVTPPIETQTSQPKKSGITATEVVKPEPVNKELMETITAVKEQATQPLVEETEKPNKKKTVTETVETKKVETEPAPQVAKKVIKEAIKKPPVPSAIELLTNSFKIASLSAEIRQKLEAKAKRPRRKFISANTKEYNYASYMEAWRSKVEQIGNLNYPEQARRQKLSGSLVLDVAINTDGTINEITIRHSSGEKILDDAAIRIVELSAPFAPFPQHIKDETDILHIMRTWQFINNKGFR